MSTPAVRNAQKHLAANCPIMEAIIARVGPCALEASEHDPLTLLVRCVVGQQISGKAAQSIFAKLCTAVGGPPLPLPKLARLREQQYKACGISGPKQRTIRAVVDHVKANADLLPAIPELSDDDIRARLTVVKGVGPWTVDMFLMFGLLRPDVWPVGDYGIKVAVKEQLKLRALPDAKKLAKVGERWKPHRTVAAWYLWRTLDKEYRERR